MHRGKTGHVHAKHRPPAWCGSWHAGERATEASCAGRSLHMDAQQEDKRGLHLQERGHLFLIQQSLFEIEVILGDEGAFAPLPSEKKTTPKPKHQQQHLSLKSVLSESYCPF